MPVDDRSHRLLVDGGQDQRRFALAFGERSLQCAQLDEHGLASVTGVARRHLRDAAKPGTQFEDGPDQMALLRPVVFQLAHAVHFSGQRGLDGVLALEDVDTYRAFTSDDGLLGFECLDAPTGIGDACRHRMVTDRDPRTGGVEQAHALVRKLSGGDVAMRQAHRRFDRFIQHLDTVMRFHHAGHRA